MDPRTSVYQGARFLLDGYPELAAGGAVVQGRRIRPLPHAEFKVHSQNGEDGVIAEMLARIGANSRTFVEFGIESGAEGNCVFLADWCGWRGLFIEADEAAYQRLETKYAYNDGVRTLQAAVTTANINSLLDAADLPYETDVLSIDVDGNDYWIWGAITRVRPRIVVIEYNASVPGGHRLVQPVERPRWDGTNAFGASIAALDSLADRLGYRLVHTDLAGVNAFFVREDLVQFFPEAERPRLHGANYNLNSESHPTGDLTGFLQPQGESHVGAASARTTTAGTALRVERVFDKALGTLDFPAGDAVMAPAIRQDGVWEQQELRWLQENVKPGSTCLNIGANVGYFACWMSRLTGPSGTVIAIEPNPELLPILRTNLVRSAFTNVEVHECAAGSEHGTTTLFLNQVNYGDSRVFDPRMTDGGGDYRTHGFLEQPKSVEVPLRRMDGVVGDRKIDVVLVDTQGWDHNALRGLSGTVARCRPVILTEFVPAWISDLGEDPEDVLKEYASWGYTLGSPDLALQRGATPRDILDAIAASPQYYANIALIPESVQPAETEKRT